MEPLIIITFLATKIMSKRTRLPSKGTQSIKRVRRLNLVVDLLDLRRLLTLNATMILTVHALVETVNICQNQTDYNLLKRERRMPRRWRI